MFQIFFNFKLKPFQYFYYKWTGSGDEENVEGNDAKKWQLTYKIAANTSNRPIPNQTSRRDRNNKKVWTKSDHSPFRYSDNNRDVI